jgi:hypothetical protein
MKILSFAILVVMIFCAQKSGVEESLLKLSEQKFRAYHQVEEGLSLSEDGRFFLPESGFFLANAMGFKDGKFWGIYKPYEIGPYVMGSTELEFSKEELASLVRW